MKSQKLQDDSVMRQAEHIAANEPERDSDSVEEAARFDENLMMILERLSLYFQGRAERNDRETLTFCLHQLYAHFDTLYCVTLLDLTTAIKESGAPKTHTRRYHIWINLQKMHQLFEQIESLCHLLLRAATNVLSILDTTSGEEGEQSSSLEQWQQAYEQIMTNMHMWQAHNEQRLSFAATFSVVKTVTSVQLAQGDTSLTLLLDSASAIFGDIVPDFQVVAPGDDEVVATLLFDLMQQLDLILIHSGTQVEPLQELFRYYSIIE